MSVWYRSGTVAVTNGSKTVTGTNTQWASLMFGVMPGTTFYGPDGKPYEVDRVVSDTSLLLITNYSGATASGQAYAIDPTRSGSVASLAAQTSEVLKFSQEQFTQMQTWVTGAANVDVTLKAPSGQTVVIPSWKKISDTVSGQATVAKTEADRSKAEADRAVTEADRAAGIVAAAALPLPDVWAPLSDSLRLITGYGRDVLVGSDVVARMVNFSRNSTATYIGKDGQLKTAAANEPRFEKEGLLIEGQSQNLVTHSVDLSAPSWNKQQAGTGSSPVVTTNYSAAPDGTMTACRLQMNRGAGTSSGDYSGVLHPISGLVAGTTHTLSVWLKSANQNSYNVSLSLNGLGLIIASITPEWKRFTITAVLDDPARYPRLQLRGGQGASDTVDILTWGWQQEALPFASSYIPTNGAAVTRAADIVTIPWAMNINPATVTVALNYDLAGINKLQRIIEYASAVNPRYLVQMSETGFMESFAGASAVAVSSAPYGAGSTMVAATSRTRHAFKLSGKAILSATPDGPAQATTVVSIGSGIAGGAPIYGHVRNLRIWHRTLTDDQIKAVA